MLVPLALAMALQSGPVFVQLPSGGFVPCDHPLAVAAGLGCGQGIPTTPTPAPRPPSADRPACDPPPNPYAEPARAAACTAWERDHTPKPVLPAFVVGATYRDPYDTFRMVVLAVSLSLEGVPVVTGEYIQGPTEAGQVFSFRANQGAPWERMP